MLVARKPILRGVKCFPERPSSKMPSARRGRENKIFAIDFDGVVHDHTHPIPGRRMGVPVEGAKEALERLSHQGEIIIFSVHAGEPKHIEDWMKYYQIPYTHVTNIKPQASIYIDDNGYHFTSWKETIEYINGSGR